MTLTELKEKLLELIAKMQEILDGAVEEERDLTAEEDENLRSFEGQMSALKRSIALKEKETPAKVEKRDIPFISVDGKDDDIKDAETEMREFLGYVRGEKRDLTTATHGSAIPASLQAKIVERVAEASQIRAVSTTMSTGSTETINVSADDTVLTFVAEGASFDVKNAGLDPKDFTPLKFGGILKASAELLNDSAANIEKFLKNALAKAKIKAENLKFIAGTGVNEPLGILNGGVEVVDSSNANNAITVAELRAFMFKIDSDFLANAQFVMNSTTLGVLKALSDDNADFHVTYDKGLKKWLVDGYETIINKNMPDIGSASTPICFGDFDFYQIVDREVADLKRLDELYAGEDKVGFRYKTRLDAKPLIASAFLLFKMAV